jgi:hypothetical protein
LTEVPKKNVNGLSDQFLARVVEQTLECLVHQSDDAVGSNQDNSMRQRLRHQPEHAGRVAAGRRRCGDLGAAFWQCQLSRYSETGVRTD